MFEKFKKNQISSSSMKMIKGGSELQGCKAATLYACEILGGERPGTVGFHECVKDGYQGCAAALA
jgi:hypothetical protein